MNIIYYRTSRTSVIQTDQKTLILIRLLVFSEIHFSLSQDEYFFFNLKFFWETQKKNLKNFILKCLQNKTKDGSKINFLLIFSF